MNIMATKKKAPTAPKAPKAPKAPVVIGPVNELEGVTVETTEVEGVVLTAPELTVEATEKLKAEWEEHKNDPNAKPATIEAPLIPAKTLANVLKVENLKGKEFSVSKDYYLNNKHKLTLINA